MVAVVATATALSVVSAPVVPSAATLAFVVRMAVFALRSVMMTSAHGPSILASTFPTTVAQNRGDADFVSGGKLVPVHILIWMAQ